jgi:hypothetical protein
MVNLSPLPKYTHDLMNYLYAKIIGREFTPKYSREEHLQEIAKYAAKHPNEIRAVYQKVGLIANQCFNMLFTPDNVQTMIKSATNNNEIVDSVTRHRPKMETGVNLPETQKRTVQHSQSIGRRGRGPR